MVPAWDIERHSLTGGKVGTRASPRSSQLPDQETRDLAGTTSGMGSLLELPSSREAAGRAWTASERQFW